MKQWEFALRIAAYACGIGGVVLAIRAPPLSAGRVAAYVMLAAMLGAFVAANLLRLTAQLRGLRRPRNAAPGRRTDVTADSTKAPPAT